MGNANNMVIIKNPTMDRKPQKSAYQPQSLESDGTIDASTNEEIDSFLETFFKLYPTASEPVLLSYTITLIRKIHGTLFIYFHNISVLPLTLTLRKLV